MSLRTVAQGLLLRAAAALGFYRHRPMLPAPSSTSVAGPGPSSPAAVTGRRRRKRRTPQPITITRWHLDDVESAQHMASSGDLTLAGRLFRSLCRDGIIHGLLGTRCGGLVRLPKRFSGDPAAVTFLEGSEGRPGCFERAFPDAELKQLDADGVVMGVGVGELLEVEGFDHPVFCRLDPEFLRYHWWEDRWYYASSDGLELITPGDGRWILHLPGGRQDPWNRGLLWALARAYISKEHAIFYRENWNSKLAHPARVAFSPQAATDEQHESWFQRVLAWGINTVFGLKPGYDVKLLESNGKGYESFKESIADSNREIMITISGSTVLVDGGTGFANADVHATIRTDLIQDDGKGLASTISTQGIPHVLRGRAPCDATATVEWDTRPPANLKSEAESLQAAAAAAERCVQVFGPGVDMKGLAQRFAVPMLAPPAAPAVGPAESVEALPPAAAANDGEMASEVLLGDEAVCALAEKMTAAGVDRCEHGRVNRCWMCGIERVRDFDLGEGGAPMWRVAWRPIRSVGEAAA